MKAFTLSAKGNEIVNTLTFLNVFWFYGMKLEAIDDDEFEYALSRIRGDEE